MAKYDIITVGSSTIDLFVYTDNVLVRKKQNGHEVAMMAYPLGTKVLINEMIRTTGGGGTNTAVGFARMGLKTAYCGVVGSNQEIMDALAKERIDFVGIRKDAESGLSVILDSKGHERTVLTYKGINDQFNLKELKLSKLDTRWFYFSSMMNKAFDELVRLSDYARKNKIKVAFNPSTYLAKKGKKYLSRILKNTDILILNDEESALIVGEKNLMKQAKELAMLGPEMVCITRGPKGVLCYDGSRYYEMPAKKVNVKESLGAGDAFASGFVSGIIKGYKTEKALKMGLANSESVIQNIGAKTGLLTFKQAINNID